MQFTLVGLIIIIAGCSMLLSKTIEAMFAFTMICTLMGGSAALVMSSLGGSSIAPSNVALVFLTLRVFLPSKNAAKPFNAAFRTNILFLCFAAYAAISAGTMPYIFKEQISVVPLKPLGLRNMYDSFPLKPSSQNITAPVYIAGSFMVAICSFIAIRQKRAVLSFVRTATWITWIHLALGIASVTLPLSVWGFFKAMFRNGSYGQLEQSIGGFTRISGIWPEPSGFAAYGFCWFALMSELWLRNVMPRRTGLAALAMALVLVASTSSTAYVSLAGYGAILVLRAMIFPEFFSSGKVVRIILAGLAVATFASLLMLANSDLADRLFTILKRMTVDKAESSSAEQRAFWAKQGFAAFKISYGLGIGAGSFRSSSLATAILGSMGLIGVATFLGYLAVIFRPMRNSSFSQSATPIGAVGEASSWAAISSMLPAVLGAASPDPGAVFSIFAGVALGLTPFRISRKPVTQRRSATSGALPLAGVDPSRTPLDPITAKLLQGRPK